MNARIAGKSGLAKNRTTVERTSDREVVVTRTINGPARIVFEALTLPALEQPMQWSRRSISWTNFSSPSVRARDSNRDDDAARRGARERRRLCDRSPLHDVCLRLPTINIEYRPGRAAEDVGTPE